MKNKKQNIWTKFKVKQELSNLVKVCIRKLLNNEKLSEKELELLKQVSK